MTRLAILITALALMLVAAVPASAHYRGVGQHCGSIQFTPQSDDGASAIRAKNVSCNRARRIVRAIRRGNNSPFDYNCRGRGHDPSNGLAHQDVICTKGDRRVTWAAY
jgi:hypothetical protein